MSGAIISLSNEREVKDMNITFGQLKKTIDKRASIMVNTNRAKDRITELLIELLDFEMINSETYTKAMNYVFQEKEW